jgi:hypothetical protein
MSKTNYNVLFHSIAEIKVLACVSNVTYHSVLHIISYINVYLITHAHCMHNLHCFIQYSLGAEHRKCMPQHKEEEGKLSRFSKNSVWYIHNITKQVCIT